MLLLPGIVAQAHSAAQPQTMLRPCEKIGFQTRFAQALAGTVPVSLSFGQREPTGPEADPVAFDQRIDEKPKDGRHGRRGQHFPKQQWPFRRPPPTA